MFMQSKAQDIEYQRVQVKLDFELHLSHEVL